MFFKPILAGASLRGRLIGSLGAVLGMAATYWLCSEMSQVATFLPLLAAPMGASAVLIFAVPASPLAQPWPVIGGNVISVLVGVTVIRFVASPPLAAGLAVGSAIVVMSLLRCLHPPGGAAALLVAIGGPSVASAGYAFALAPVGINAVVLTMAGLLFHRLAGTAYPHRSIAKPPGATDLLHREDIDAALADFGETLDVSRDDLEILLRKAEDHASRRMAMGVGVGQVSKPPLT